MLGVSVAVGKGVIVGKKVGVKEGVRVGASVSVKTNVKVGRISWGGWVGESSTTFTAGEVGASTGTGIVNTQADDTSRTKNAAERIKFPLRFMSDWQNKDYRLTLIVTESLQNAWLPL